MIRSGTPYIFGNLIKKGETFRLVISSTLGYAAPKAAGTFPNHRLILPEEEPANGTKRSVHDAFESPQSPL